MFLDITNPEVHTWAKGPSVTISLNTSEEVKTVADYFKGKVLETLTSGSDTGLAEKDLSRASMLYRMVDVFKKYEEADDNVEESDDE